MAYIKPTNSNPYAASISDKISPPKYTGKETDTMEIIVNNERATIEGNVKWKSFLGETEDKAFPGNKGLEHHNQILATMRNLNAEIKRSTQADNVLSDMISALNSKNANLMADITDELTSLKKSLSDYATALTALESLLNEKISDTADTLMTEVETERISRKDGDDFLQSSIASESVRAINKEKELSVGVKTLQDRVTSIESTVSSIPSEIESAIQGISETSGASINQEIEDRKEADENLSALINDTVNLLNSLVIRIDTLSHEVDMLSDTTAKDISNLEVSLHNTMSEEASIREVKDLEIEGRVDSLEKHDYNTDIVLDRLDNHQKTLAAETETYIRGMDIRLTSRVDTMKDSMDKFYEDYNDAISQVNSKVTEIVTPIKTDVEQLNQELSIEINRATAMDANIQSSIVSLDDKIDRAVKQSEEEVAYVWNATTEWIKEVEASIADSKEIIESIDLIDGGNAPVLH